MPCASRASTATLKKSLRLSNSPNGSRAVTRFATCPNLIWLDVGSAAHIVAAAARQPRIERCLDAERVVVRRADEQVVGHALAAAGLARVAAVVVVVAAGDRKPGPELVLDFGREVPVGVALAVAFQHCRIPAGRVRVVLAEVVVVDGRRIRRWPRSSRGRSPARSSLSVSPSRYGSSVRRHRRRNRVQAFGEVGAELGQVPSELRLERGAAVAEQVVGDAHSRAPVLPVRDVVPRRERALAEPLVGLERARPAVGVARDACLLFRHVAVEAVPAQAEVQRHPLVERSTGPARRCRGRTWFSTSARYGVARWVIERGLPLKNV